MSKNDENISSEDHIFDRNEKYIDELQSFLFTDWKKKNENNANTNDDDFCLITIKIY